MTIADTPGAARSEPIAIVGLACRFPNAIGPRQLRELLKQSGDAIADIPASRFLVDSSIGSYRQEFGRYSRWGGFLSQKLNEFDFEFFELSAREAAEIDPQQRLLLEVAWEALEDAGQTRDGLTREEAGLYLAICSNDHDKFLIEADVVDEQSLASGMANSGVLSQVLKVRGPSVTLNNFESCSLQAIHLACQSLQTRECTIAVCGGANLLLSPQRYFAYSAARLLSPSGRCKSYDKNSDGIVPGEGAGIVVLKRLSDAVRDGDEIRATILGISSGHDGGAGPSLGPSRQELERLFFRTCEKAGIHPNDIQYVEGSGSGIAALDTVELEAVERVFGHGRDNKSRVAIGSIKSNFGHMAATNGVASLIKLTLSLQNQELFASLHAPQPAVLPHVEVQQKGGQWNSGPGKTLLGAVSSISLAKSNACVILGKAPPTPSLTSNTRRGKYVLTLSARSATALESQAQAYADSLSDHSDLMSLSYTLNNRRTHFEHRLALVASSIPEARAKLLAAAQQKSTESMVRSKVSSGSVSKTAFVFGESDKVDNSLTVLEKYEAFENEFCRWDIAAKTIRGQSLREEIRDGRNVGASKLLDIAVQVSTAAFWQSLGIVPSAVCGLGLGEVAAAYASRALTIECAAKILQLADELANAPGVKLHTLLLRAPPLQVASLILKHDKSAFIRAHLGSKLTLVVVANTALASILDECDHLGIRIVETSQHLWGRPEQRDVFLGTLGRIEATAASVPFFSTFAPSFGRRAGDVLKLGADYWWKTLSEPGHFSSAMTDLLSSHFTAFLAMTSEVAISESLSEAVQSGETKAELVRGAPASPNSFETILDGTLSFYGKGASLHWDKLYLEPATFIPALPYAWHRMPLAPRLALLDRPEASGAIAHPLLRRRLKSAEPAGSYYWEIVVDTRIYPHLRDHRIHGAVVLPGMVTLEMVFAAISESLGSGPKALFDVEFQKGIFLSDATPTNIQLIVTPENPNWFTFYVYGRAAKAQQSEPWMLHVNGRINYPFTGPPPKVVRPESPKDLREQVLSSQDFYEQLSVVGNEYGPQFQVVRNARVRDGHVRTEVELPESFKPETAWYEFHPVLLDGCIQAIAAIDGIKSSFVPTRIQQVVCWDKPQARLLSTVEKRAAGLADITVSTPTGEPVISFTGFAVHYFSSDKELGVPTNTNEWLHEIVWEAKVRPEITTTLENKGRGTWVILADHSGVGKALASRMESQSRDQCILLLPALRKDEEFNRIDETSFRVRPGNFDDMAQVLNSISHSQRSELRGIVHLWALDVAAPESLTAQSLEPSQMLTVAAVLPLVRVLKTINRPSPHIWMVSRGAQQVDNLNFSPSVAQASLWGLGRSLSVEVSELWGGLIDLDPAASPLDSAQFLSEEILKLDGEDQVAVRNNRRFVTRLMRANREQPVGPPLTFNSEGTYLITGGLGGLGLEIASWMVKRGAKSLILMGRTKIPAKYNWGDVRKGTPLARQIAAIQSFEDAGAKIHIASTDVADESQLLNFLAHSKERERAPIRGIIHGAGRIEAHDADAVDVARAMSIIRPKAFGAWLLHQAFIETPLDFFVILSSAASLLSSPRLSSYAAASSFVDALAAHRRSLGLPATVVNWGPWAKIGMSARTMAEGWGASTLKGMGSIEPWQGIELLEKLMRNSATQTAVLPINWKQWRELYPEFTKAPLFSHLVAESVQPAIPQPASTLGIRNVIEATSVEDRLPMLEQHLTNQVLEVLRVTDVELNIHHSLVRLGIDSLMAAELKVKIEVDLGIVIPIVRLLEGISISQLASLLLNQWDSNQNK